jgi:hypothetical protein
LEGSGLGLRVEEKKKRKKKKNSVRIAGILAEI